MDTFLALNFAQSPAVCWRCRCHPAIAAVSNHSFYGGRLLDGCTLTQRGPLLPGLPPLLCLDVRGSQQYASGSGSASNQAEARAVVQVTT